jgi:hypothetical protein
VDSYAVTLAISADSPEEAEAIAADLFLRAADKRYRDRVSLRVDQVKIEAAVECSEAPALPKGNS